MKALLVNTARHAGQCALVWDTLRWLGEDLRSQGWDVETCMAGDAASFRKTLTQSRPDVTLCYDYDTDDGHSIRDICGDFGIPDVFARQPILDLFKDKHATKCAAAAAGLMVLPDLVVTPHSAPSTIPFAGPYMVKPRFGGDSRGIEGGNVHDSEAQALAFARDAATASRADQVIEPFFGGDDIREFAVFALPGRHRCISSVIAYDYDVPPGQEARYISKVVKDDERWQLRFSVAPHRDDLLIARRFVGWLDAIDGLAVVRAEFLAGRGAVVLNEVNGIPGINECFKMTAVANGLSRAALVDHMFAGAVLGHRQQARSVAP